MKTCKTTIHRPCTCSSPLLFFFFLVVSSLIQNPNTCAAKEIKCTTTSQCVEKLRDGSTCNSNGYCTNPLIGGCLHYQYNTKSFDTQINGIQKFVKDKKRVCNSDDPPDAIQRNICQKPNPYFNYTEIRIAPADWDSAVFFAWIMQILLSEVLLVPATIDNGKEESLSFYDEGNGLTHSTDAYPWEGFVKANERNGDCSQVKPTEFCNHVFPEVWVSTPEEYEDSSEREFNGMIGATGWYIPSFTLDEYPTFSNYVGLHKAGDKLAEIFKRPTTWKDYCTQVSPHNCSIDDGVAKRKPINEEEETSYFVTNEYIGHFRYTMENNCSSSSSSYPDMKCSGKGHIIDYPCGWQSYFERQAYWHDISLDNDVMYKRHQIRQVFQASNATKSHAIITWWYPEPTIVQGYERISLPRATGQCLRERAKNLNVTDRCDTVDKTIQLRSTKITSCDHPAFQSINKYYAKSLMELSLNFSKAMKNPAYDLLSSIRLSGVDIMDILEDVGQDANNYDARDAVCKWVIRNFDRGSNLTKYLPLEYPLEVTDEGIRSISIGSIILGSISIFSVLLVISFIYYWRQRKVIKYAQQSFLHVFCAGFMSISIAALFYGFVPSTETCMMREWFDLLGHTIVMIPLLLKFSVINALKEQYKRKHRFQAESVIFVASEKRLYLTSAIALCICIIYLICWSAIDPSIRQQSAILLGEGNNAGKVLVQVSCSSSTLGVWKVFACIVVGFCVICIFLLKFQSKAKKTLFNELTHLSSVVYATFSFFVFRSILIVIPNAFSSDPKVHDTSMSIILSLDVVVNLSFYFLPKFWMMYTDSDSAELSESVIMFFSNKEGEQLLRIESEKLTEDDTNNTTTTSTTPKICKACTENHERRLRIAQSAVDCVPVVNSASNE